MELKSSAYRAGSAMPITSPQMAWKGAPAQTKSFAFILHDPDAPVRGGFTHWGINNMDAKLNQPAENIPRQGNVARVGMQGKNDAGQIGYMGPCPPVRDSPLCCQALRAEYDAPSETGRNAERNGRCHARTYPGNGYADWDLCQEGGNASLNDSCAAMRGRR